MAEQSCYTLLNVFADSQMPSEQQLKNDFEKGDTRTKIEALKKAIAITLNGEKMPSLLMHVIRFVLPLQDHTIKKLLLLFWEVVPKTHSDGKLMQEMILVCDAYRRDLQHPNEYIRGSTLRFLCKLNQHELLEPLMPAIRACLEHRHSYVRRNCVLAIYTIYKRFDFLIPDAPEMIASYLEQEQDMSCRRNAFMMLIQADQDRALDYLSSCIDNVGSFGDILQLVIVQLIYKVCIANPMERARFIRCIYNLLNSSSLAVRYEAAGTLVTLSHAPTAIKAASQCYIDLVAKESDNNVKLIVLDRLIELHALHGAERIMQEQVLDLLRILSSPDLEVRRKTLELALDLASQRNIDQMVGVLKKHVVKTESAVERKDALKYRQLLVRALHKSCVRYPLVAPSVIPVLTEFLSDSYEQAALDVLVFFREAIERFPDLRCIIITNLIQVFPTIRGASVTRSALWILGEYCQSEEEMQGVFHEIRQSLGELPLVEAELRKIEGEANAEALQDDMMTSNVKRLVTADGSYATQSALTNASSKGGKKEKDEEEKEAGIRRVFVDGDFFTASALANALTKLALHYCDLIPNEKVKQNKILGEAMWIISSIMHYGKSGLPKQAINDDDFERIATCLRALVSRADRVVGIYCTDCRHSLADLLQQLKLASVENEGEDLAFGKRKGKGNWRIQPDAVLQFSQLAGNNTSDAEDIFQLSLSAAIGSNTIAGESGDKNNFDFSSSKLSKVTQLTGFSDPVYAEAYVTINQYDIVLDVLIVNQTDDTLEGVSLELATLGDSLKLVEKPVQFTLGPRDFTNVKASVKVASTENGIIFGSLVYDIRASGGDRNCVVLNYLSIDIMDYIVPASCTDNEFREMWAEFEWENKVTVNTPILELRQYLNCLIRSTNMRCLTPDKALRGDCGFLAANLYAKSIFGEDALANISIEKSSENAVVTGHIRIRAKSQGMALSLGDKISAAQKRFGKQFLPEMEDDEDAVPLTNGNSDMVDLDMGDDDAAAE